MTFKTLTIAGKPFAKERPRFAHGKAYTPKKTLTYEARVANLYQTKYHDDDLITGPVIVNMFCYFPIPKSVSKKKKEMMLNGRIKPTNRKDLDNIAKILCDSLNLIAYHDDSQIVELYIKKEYSEKPRVKIILKEIK